jgi:hypothetical protein
MTGGKGWSVSKHLGCCARKTSTQPSDAHLGRLRNTFKLVRAKQVMRPHGLASKQSISFAAYSDDMTV